MVLLEVELAVWSALSWANFQLATECQTLCRIHEFRLALTWESISAHSLMLRKYVILKRRTRITNQAGPSNRGIG